MPAERTAMRQVRDVLRLKTAGVAINEIARRVGVASSTVRLTLQRLAAAGLGWPLPAEMTDTALEEQLFTAVGKKQGHRRRAEPDWAAVHRELKRKHVTLQILWDEYIERHPEGYRYSRFCELYRGWAARLSVTMRQSHAGGDKLFVDYAGDTVPVIIDRLSGKTRPAQIFVAVLGASNFTYAEASWTQALGDWIGAHTRAFEAIGGVPNLLVYLCIDYRRRRGAMSYVIADRLERKTAVHQPLDAGMPQRVGSWPQHRDASLLQILAGNARHCCMGQRRSRRKVTPEEHSALHIGPAILQVIDDGLANDRRQRIGSGMIGLTLTHMQSVTLPVEVVERQS